MAAAWNLVRAVLVFLIGVAVILDALDNPGRRPGELILGAVLIGVVPLGDVTAWLLRRKGPPCPNPPTPSTPSTPPA